MTVTEQPVSSVATDSRDESDPGTPSGAEVNLNKKKVLRETLIALGVLFVLFIGVLVYFAASQDSEAGQPNTTPGAVSTAEWLNRADEADSPSGTPASHEATVPPHKATVPIESAPSETGYAPPPPEPAQPEEEVVLSEGARTGTVESGVPVITSLQKLGLSIQQAHEIITALDGVFDFRRSRPGDEFELDIDDKGTPKYFAYRRSLTEVYEVKRQGDSLKGRKKKIPTTHMEKRFGGTIASSLYKSLADAGAHPSLAGKIADILSNEVDFFKEQRPGDTFRVIVDEETLNETFLGYGPVLALEYNGVKAGKKRLIRFETDGKNAEYFSDKGISQPRSVISIPLHYTRISSRFGMRYHPVLKRKKLHNGVDFAASTGSPVWSCAEGTIIIAGMQGANGNLVGIDHGDGLVSYYAHLSRFAKGIKQGLKVRQRQVIGYVGNTGRSTGPHLHFGLKKGGQFIDPLKYKVQPGRPVESKYRKNLKALIKDMSGRLDATRITPPSEPLAEVPDNDEVLGLEDW